MAHTRCINGHDMWNGDGKPNVNIYNLTKLLNELKNNPDVMYLHGRDLNGTPVRITEEFIYDVAEKLEDCGEYEGWFCDECNTLCVFNKNNTFRYDYVMDNDSIPGKLMDYHKWDTYIGPRDGEFMSFLDYENGNDSGTRIVKPLNEALNGFKFEYYYKVCFGFKNIYAFDANKKFKFAMKLARKLKL